MMLHYILKNLFAALGGALLCLLISFSKQGECMKREEKEYYDKINKEIEREEEKRSWNTNKAKEERIPSPGHGNEETDAHNLFKHQTENSVSQVSNIHVDSKYAEKLDAIVDITVGVAVAGGLMASTKSINNNTVQESVKIAGGIITGVATYEASAKDKRTDDQTNEYNSKDKTDKREELNNYYRDEINKQNLITKIENELNSSKDKLIHNDYSIQNQQIIEEFKNQSNNE